MRKIVLASRQPRYRSHVASKAKRAKPAPKPTPAPNAKPVPKPAEWPRDAALEQAILDAPLDPVPRMVYADWLQAAGDRRGEWMSLHAAIEADPRNVRLRSAAVDFLGANLDLLLGPGKSLLAGGWIGWRAGFIDELRIQRSHKRGPLPAFASLLAHPSCRFVRCVGLGDLGQDAIDALVAAAPPLLDTVVAIDVSDRADVVDLDGLAALPIRRLGLHAATITKPMPQLRELAGSLGGMFVSWIVDGGCGNLERLTLDCSMAVASINKVLRAVPKLRELRLLHVGPSELGEITRLKELELLDLSHARIGDADVERLIGWRGLRLILHRTQVSNEALARLVRGGVTVVASPGTSRLDNDHTAGGWLHDRLATDGRDGLRLMPGIGRTLFNVGTHHSMYGDPKDATPILDASLTFPNEHLKTWAWANAAIAHERVHAFDDAELIAREGLLRSPKEPNLYAIVIDALRRTGRLTEALALLPRAMSSVEARPGPGAHSGGRAACLADVLLVLAQAGRHEALIELADESADLVDQRTDMHAIVAMSYVALGDVAKARTSLAAATSSPLPGVLLHAKAVVALAAKRPDTKRALELLGEAKDAPYPEWHWIATDPNLGKLRGHVVFKALVAA